MKYRGRVRTAGAVGRLAIIVTLLIAGAAGIALAHATLRRADPPSGGRVTLPPAQLRLEFSEAVAARTSRIALVAPDSQRFGLVLRSDSGNSKVLLAEVPSLRVAGLYRVEWRLVGPDGHAVTGQYGFTVDSIAVAPAIERTPAGQEDIRESSTDSLVQQAIRFASSLSLLVIIGSAAFALFVLPFTARADSSGSADFGNAVDRRLRWLCTLGGWSLLILAVVRLVSHGVVLSGSMEALRLGDLADLLTGTTYGRGWVLQVSAAIALLLALRTALSTRWSVLAGIAALLAISSPFLGHPSAVTDVPVVAMGLDAVHVLAAGGWAGAILVMAVVALPQVFSIPAAGRLELARNMLRAFSPLALTCAAALVVTGTASAWLQLRDLGLVLGSTYGLVLLRKVVLVLLIAVLGAYHWRVAQPSLDTDRSIARLGRSIALDVVLVLLVLILTAILTGTTPPVR